MEKFKISHTSKTILLITVVILNIVLIGHQYFLYENYTYTNPLTPSCSELSPDTCPNGTDCKELTTISSLGYQLEEKYYSCRAWMSPLFEALNL